MSVIRMTPKYLVNVPLGERLGQCSIPEPMSGCTIWLRNKVDGYGAIWVNGGKRLAHRLAWEIEHGPVPPGLVLDHICRNRACVNTQHLRTITNRENILLGECPSAKHRRQTHCKNGHEYTEKSRKRGRRRRCDTCDAERARQRYRTRTNWRLQVEGDGQEGEG